MKITKKGVLITIPVFLTGSFLIAAPQYGFMLVKHSMISYENEKEAKKEDHWIYNENGRRFVYHDGPVIQNVSQVLDRIMYYFDGKGYVKTGWVQDKGQIFYRNPDGSPVVGWFTDDSGTYYLNENGSPAIGWTDVDGQHYYFKENGAAATGMTEVDGVQYLFNEDGTVSAGWVLKLSLIHI